MGRVGLQQCLQVQGWVFCSRMGPIGDSFATPVSSQTHGALSSEPQKATIKKLSLLPSKKPEDDAFRTVSKLDLKVNRNEGLRSYRF